MSFTVCACHFPVPRFVGVPDEFNALAIARKVQPPSRQAFMVAITDCSTGKGTSSSPDRWNPNGS
jgi:hypothetical protein